MQEQKLDETARKHALEMESMKEHLRNASKADEEWVAKEARFAEELEQMRQREHEEKQKLRVQINNEKKLTEEAVKKLFQIVQEKKPKSGNVKNAGESKRIEKENKRLQLELSKERENYAQMHKLLNQEIQGVCFTFCIFSKVPFKFSFQISMFGAGTILRLKTYLFGLICIFVKIFFDKSGNMIFIGNVIFI